MLQWVKNPIATAWVASEAQIRSPAPRTVVKGSGIAIAVAQVTAAAQIQSLAQEYLYTVGVAKKQTNKRKTLNFITFRSSTRYL